jgi:YfiH family protein
MMNLVQNKNGLKYYEFESLHQLGIRHGFYTRLGGVSPEPFASLNMATTVGDSSENVLENLRRMFETQELDLESRYDGWQVHSSTCICVEYPRDVRSRAIRTDGLITSNPEVTLVMRFGDCVPVVLYDPVQRVVGIYHAGWMGTVKKIAKNMVRTMEAVYGCNPGDLYAGIGPSIGPDHFEVREDVSSQFEKVFADDADALIQKQAGRTTIDLWKANQLTLEAAGVKRIDIMEICTVCNRHEWFSHRGDRGRTGRFGAMITLKGS